ncbi:hypothetical protein ACFLYL_03995 [Chloroflexota bacterium]
MKVLNPVGEKRRVDVKGELAARLDTIDGKIIGIIDDGAGKTYFQRIEELLEEKARPSRVIHKLRPHLSQPSPAELIDEIAKSCDAAIVGIGI